MNKLLVGGTLFAFLVVTMATGNALVVTLPSSIATTMNATGTIGFNLTITNLDYPIFAQPFLFLPNFDSSINPSAAYPISNNGTIPNVITVSVPQNYPAGTYNGNVTYVINYTSYSIPLAITVPQLNSYSVTPNITINTTSGSTGYFAIDITNYGNTNVNLGFNCTYYCSNNYSNIVVYKNSVTSIPVSYILPNNLSGTYVDRINIGNQATLVNYNVIDNQKPTMKTIGLSQDQEVMKPFVLFVDAKDNVGIKKVNATTCYGDSKQLLRGDNYYEETFIINQTGDCDITITAVDVNNNTATIVTSVNVASQSGTFITENLIMPKLKLDQEYTKNFLKLSDSTAFTISYDNIIFEGQYNETNSSQMIVRIVSSQGTTTLEKGGVANLNAVGDVGLLIKGLVISNYKLYFTLTFPQGIFGKTSYSVIASGEISNYFVNQNYQGLIGGLNATCIATDTGLWVTSYYDCTFRYPVDVDLSRLTAVRTQADLDNQQRTCDDNTKIANDRANFNSNLFILFLVLFLAMVVWKFVVPKMKDKSVVEVG